MDKPKRFFHKERRETSPETDFRFATYATYLHAGRVGIEANAFGLLLVVILGVTGLIQMLLAWSADWVPEQTNWLPSYILAGALTLYCVIYILIGISMFFKYIASKIVIDGPGE